MSLKIFYYDADAKHLVPFVEGTDLKAVIGLRCLAQTLIAFNEDGWVVGVLSDGGGFTPLPAGETPRHISDYGTKFPVSKEKPEMLRPLAGPEPVGTVPVLLEAEDRVRIGVGRVILLRHLSGRLVLRFEAWPDRVVPENLLRLKFKDLEWTEGLKDRLRADAAAGRAFVVHPVNRETGTSAVCISPPSIADILVAFAKER